MWPVGCNLAHQGQQRLRFDFDHLLIPCPKVKQEVFKGPNFDEKTQLKVVRLARNFNRPRALRAATRPEKTALTT